MGEVTNPNHHEATQHRGMAPGSDHPGRTGHHSDKDTNDMKKLSITDQDLKEAGITKRGRLKGTVWTQRQIDMIREYYGPTRKDILLELMLKGL